MSENDGGRYIWLCKYTCLEKQKKRTGSSRTLFQKFMKSLELLYHKLLGDASGL